MRGGGLACLWAATLLSVLGGLYLVANNYGPAETYAAGLLTAWLSFWLFVVHMERAR